MVRRSFYSNARRQNRNGLDSASFKAKVDLTRYHLSRPVPENWPVLFDGRPEQIPKFRQMIMLFPRDPDEGRAA